MSNQIVDDTTKVIQSCRIYAEMRSSTAVNNEKINDFVYSFMGICIFASNGIEFQSILAMISENIEWDRYAVNLCFDDM